MRKEIKLTKGAVAIVDPEDYEALSASAWHLATTGYATRKTWKSTILMHRQILGTSSWGQYVDHINGDKLDNRKSNIRICTASENRANVGKQLRGGKAVSKYKGVTYDPRRPSPWRGRARGMPSKSFETELEAAAYYNEMATLIFGRFAKLNELPKNNLPKPKTRGGNA